MERFNLQEVSYRELDGKSAADLDGYETIILAGMDEDDVHLRYEFETRLLDGRVRAWWVEYRGEILGWCALAPTHRRYFPGAAHLYGTWVRANARRQGLGGAMWRFLFEQIPADVPVTVSIKAGNTSGEKLTKRFGFRELSTIGPWVNYVREPA